MKIVLLILTAVISCFSVLQSKTYSILGKARAKPLSIRNLESLDQCLVEPAQQQFRLQIRQFVESKTLKEISQLLEKQFIPSLQDLDKSMQKKQISQGMQIKTDKKTLQQCLLRPLKFLCSIQKGEKPVTFRQFQLLLNQFMNNMGVYFSLADIYQELLKNNKKRDIKKSLSRNNKSTLKLKMLMNQLHQMTDFLQNGVGDSQFTVCSPDQYLLSFGALSESMPLPGDANQNLPFDRGPASYLICPDEMMHMQKRQDQDRASSLVVDDKNMPQEDSGLEGLVERAEKAALQAEDAANRTAEIVQNLLNDAKKREQEAVLQAQEEPQHSDEGDFNTHQEKNDQATDQVFNKGGALKNTDTSDHASSTSLPEISDGSDEKSGLGGVFKKIVKDVVEKKQASIDTLINGSPKTKESSKKSLQDLSNKPENPKDNKEQQQQSTAENFSSSSSPSELSSNQPNNSDQTEFINGDRPTTIVYEDTNGDVLAVTEE